jgi:hypothetical protein
MPVLRDNMADNINLARAAQCILDTLGHWNAGFAATDYNHALALTDRGSCQ